LDKGKAYKAIDRLAVHDIRGKLKTLESLGIISRSEVRKRLKNDLPITECYEKHGEIFVAPINQRLLKNEIHHKICGRDWSTSNAIKNKQGCKNFSNKFVEKSTKVDSLPPTPRMLAFQRLRTRSASVTPRKMYS
jgi:hypothetical protein